MRAKWQCLIRRRPECRQEKWMTSNCSAFEVSAWLSWIYPLPSVKRKGGKREGNERGRWKRKKRQKDAYLTHGCGFAGGKIFDIRSSKADRFSSSRLESLLFPRRVLFALVPAREEVRCARSSVSFRSERRTAARATGQGRRLTSKGLATCFPLCVLGVAVRRLSHWLRWEIERSKIHLWKTAGCKGDDA